MGIAERQHYVVRKTDGCRWTTHLYRSNDNIMSFGRQMGVAERQYHVARKTKCREN